jgi:hypothetical protein
MDVARAVGQLDEQPGSARVAAGRERRPLERGEPVGDDPAERGRDACDHRVEELSARHRRGIAIAQRVIRQRDDRTAVAGYDAQVVEDRREIGGDLVRDPEQLGVRGAVIGRRLLTEEGIVGADVDRDETGVVVRCEIVERCVPWYWTCSG